MSGAGERLVRAGVRPTEHRREVLDAVLAAGRAVTAPELEELLAGRMNRVTLYRTLDLLAAKGVLLRTSGPGRAFQYCPGRGHGHFHCRGCGRTECLDLPEMTSGALQAALHGHGRVEAVDLRLEGLCEDCLKK